MTAQLPQVIHMYQNHTLDSTRWNSYKPRPDDIIATAYKSGTTWMQEIVRQLVFCDQDGPERHEIALGELSPWFDPRWDALDVMLAKLEAQQHRRFIKTHIPLDGLPFFPQVKYIIVGRDPRDVFMSLWNFHANFTPDFRTFMNTFPDRVGDPFPACPADIHTFWHDWITRGWFAWESEGYPYWGNLRHTQSWWAYRHLPNLLFVHYNDLKRDLTGEIQRVADFLNIPLRQQMLPTILEAVSLEAMRTHAEKFDPGLKTLLTEGAHTFFFKGTNGRWQDVLSTEELALYDATAAKVLTLDCRAWLEQGRLTAELWQGVSMRLYLRQVGLLPSFGDVAIPGYLIQTDDGKNILIDSGCPRGILAAQEQAATQWLEAFPNDKITAFNATVVRGLRNATEDLVTHRLTVLGLTPQDIDYLVCSHFDLDHAGNHDLFPNAELVVQRAHYAVAHQHPHFCFF